MPKPRRITGKTHYERIAERTLQPKPQSMSARALGVLVHLLSQPADWTTNAEKLARVFTEGREAMETALAELESLGFLARKRVRHGSRWTWVWIFGDDRDAVADDFAKLLALYGATPDKPVLRKVS